jgi:hypothetical protein
VYCLYKIYMYVLGPSDHSDECESDADGLPTLVVIRSELAAVRGEVVCPCGARQLHDGPHRPPLPLHREPICAVCFYGTPSTDAGNVKEDGHPCRLHASAYARRSCMHTLLTTRNRMHACFSVTPYRCRINALLPRRLSVLVSPVYL